MKKTIFGFVSLVIVIIGCAGSPQPVATTEINSGLLTLDQAIAEAATRIDERIMAGAKIAPLNFNSPHDRFSDYVLEELTANLVDSRKLTVVDRREIDLIRNEFDFQLSGEVGDDSMQQLGRMLGAQAIISGTFTDLGGFYRIMIRVLNVQNASVEVQYRANIANDNITSALLTGGRTATATQQRTTTAQASTAQVPTVPVAQTQVPATSVVQAPAPVQAPEPALANGTYTFRPRPQAYQGARAVNVFVDNIVVRSGYMTIYLRPVPQGESNYLNSVGRNWSDAGTILRDLDRPARSYTPLEGDIIERGFLGAWITFKDVTATRFSLTSAGSDPRMVFDEIQLGKPD